MQRRLERRAFHGNLRKELLSLLRGLVFVYGGRDRGGRQCKEDSSGALFATIFGTSFSLRAFSSDASSSKLAQRVVPGGLGEGRPLSASVKLH